LLAKENRTEAEERLLAAFRWAGRATVAARPEEAFLLYAIALESLILGPTDGKRGELTYQLKVRAARLLARVLDRRTKISTRVQELYDVRSAIAHAGSREVDDVDLNGMRQLAKASIIAFLDRRDLLAMTHKELRDWFDAQALRG
jgi:hypothetical protein